VVQLINPVGDIPKETFSGRLDSGVHYQHEEYLIPYLHNGDGDDQLISQPDGVSEGIPLVKHNSSIVYEEEHAACDICNGSGEELKFDFKVQAVRPNVRTVCRALTVNLSTMNCQRSCFSSTYSNESDFFVN